MLPRLLRLPVGQNPHHAKRIIVPIFTLGIWKNNQPTNRYGFVIAKRIDKRAVVRNRLKRVLRSCIEELHPTLTQGQDMLFVIQKNFEDLKREEVLEIVKQAVAIKN